MKYKIKWAIGKDGNDSQSEEYVIEKTNDDVEEGKEWYTVDIQDLGEKPIDVSEG